MRRRAALPAKTRPSERVRPPSILCGALPHMSGVILRRRHKAAQPFAPRSALCGHTNLLSPGFFCAAGAKKRIAAAQTSHYRVLAASHSPRVFRVHSAKNLDSRRTDSDTAFRLCGLAGSLSPGLFCATGAKKRIAAARTFISYIALCGYYSTAKRLHASKTRRQSCQPPVAIFGFPPPAARRSRAL